MKTVIARRDDASPFLKDLQASLKPNSAASRQLRGGIAARLEKLTRNHILFASASRHKTAQRLGATPTGYLVRLAQSVETEVNPGANTPCRVYVYGEIFSRVDGPVKVRPRRKQWLAIPATRLAYGRRPHEIPGLRFMLMKKDKLAALVSTVRGGKPDAKGRKPVKIWYWLKKGVTLPQDQGLLPTAKHYADEMELAAIDFLIELEKQPRTPVITTGRRK
ncbi:MAG: hypothetical protein V4662_17685 [Verrucomicrobiota bacterium]